MFMNSSRLTSGRPPRCGASAWRISLFAAASVPGTSQSASAMAKTFGDIGGRLGSSLMTEAGHASQAATAMVSAGSPAAALHAQYSYAVGWWGRAAGQMLALNTELLKGHADALRPIHKTAVANAKRLRK